MYNAYSHRMKYYISTWTNGKEIDDIHQELFLKVYSNLSTFDVLRGQMTTWIYRIARNTSIDWLRKRKRVNVESWDNLCEPLGNIFSDVSAEPLEQLLSKEKQENLFSSIERLPSSEKRLTLLYYYEELSINEIAIIYNIPEGTVKSRLNGVRQKLKRTLEDNT